MSDPIKKRLTLICFYLVILICFLFSFHSAIAQDAQSKYEQGYQNFTQGEYQKAKDNYLEAIKYDPDFENAHYWLGKVYRELDENNSAIEQWIEVLRINPRNPYAFKYLINRHCGTYQVQSKNSKYYLLH